MTEKYVRGGFVAILVSPGFGAGWSTWANDGVEAEKRMFSPELVHAVLTKTNKVEILAIAKRLFPDFPDVYHGGVEDLVVEWIPEGTLFRINEYDGNETVELFDASNYYKA